MENASRDDFEPLLSAVSISLTWFPHHWLVVYFRQTPALYPGLSEWNCHGLARLPGGDGCERVS